MQAIIQALFNALFQTAFLTAVPFAYYAYKYRKSRGFFNWLGIYQPQGRTMGLALLFSIAGMVIWLVAFNLPGLRQVAIAPNTVAGQLREAGFSAVTLTVMLIQVFLQTALSEEIFFRGFLARRLINWLGFAAGNLVQALLFGLVHINLFLSPEGPALTVGSALPVLLLTGAYGWGMGWLNERLGNGSIVPSWLVHGLSNLAAFSLLAFVL